MQIRDHQKFGPSQFRIAAEPLTTNHTDNLILVSITSIMRILYLQYDYCHIIFILDTSKCTSIKCPSYWNFYCLELNLDLKSLNLYFSIVDRGVLSSLKVILMVAHLFICLKEILTNDRSSLFDPASYQLIGRSFESPPPLRARSMDRFLSALSRNSASVSGLLYLCSRES